MSIGWIIIAIIILTVLSGIANAPRKHNRRKSLQTSGDDSANGCIGCLGVIAVVVAVFALIEFVGFVRAHSTFFIICGIFAALVGIIVFVVYNSSEDTGTTVPPPPGSIKASKESVSLFSAHNEPSQVSRKESVRTKVSVLPKSKNLFPATYEEVVGKKMKEKIFPTATEIAGKEGEDNVSRAVWAACQYDGRHYKLLRNVYVRKPNGTTTEIDVLLLHETGVYVFESKNLQGSVYGDMAHSQWQRFKKNGDKDYIPNPILQNEGHVRALCEFLAQDKWQFRAFSMIVFGTRAKLKFIPEDSSFTSIHEVYNLEMDLMKKLSVGTQFYSAETIDNWCRKLLPGTMLSDEEKRAHVERITRKFGKIS